MEPTFVPVDLRPPLNPSSLESPPAGGVVARKIFHAMEAIFGIFPHHGSKFPEKFHGMEGSFSVFPWHGSQFPRCGTPLLPAKSGRKGPNHRASRFCNATRNAWTGRPAVGPYRPLWHFHLHPEKTALRIRRPPFLHHPRFSFHHILPLILFPALVQVRLPRHLRNPV